MRNMVSLMNGSSTYHARGAGEEDLRFVKIVDTCQDGARGADLETGIWERVP